HLKLTTRKQNGPKNRCISDVAEANAVTGVWAGIIIPEQSSKRLWEMGCEKLAAGLASSQDSPRVWIHYGGGQVTKRGILSDWLNLPDWASECKLPSSLLTELARLKAIAMPWGFQGHDGKLWPGRIVKCYDQFLTCGTNRIVPDFQGVISRLDLAWKECNSCFDP
ncbi:MAG: hypothetical protein WCK77_08425, partial [Verrucomicrobiota bacterium]